MGQHGILTRDDATAHMLSTMTLPLPQHMPPLEHCSIRACGLPIVLAPFPLWLTVFLDCLCGRLQCPWLESRDCVLFVLVAVLVVLNFVIVVVLIAVVVVVVAVVAVVVVVVVFLSCLW